MRPWPLVVVAMLALSGCVADNEVDPAAADQLHAGDDLVDPIWDTTDAVRVMERTTRWHDPQRSPLEAYGLVVQGAVRTCLFQSEGEEHASPYVGTLNLTQQPLDHHVPHGATHLEITLSWSDLDWTGTSLWLAYKGGEKETYRMTPELQRDAPTLVPLRDNTTEDGPTSSWDIWACTVNADDIGPAQPFLGSLHATIDVQRHDEATNHTQG